jgi:hypothetical protein
LVVAFTMSEVPSVVSSADVMRRLEACIA